MQESQIYPGFQAEEPILVRIEYPGQDTVHQSVGHLRLSFSESFHLLSVHRCSQPSLKVSEKNTGDAQVSP